MGHKSEHDDELAPTLHERYERLKAELENGDQDILLDRLHSPSLFDDSDDGWEHDIGEIYRHIKQREADGELLVNWDADLDTLEAKYGAPNLLNAVLENDIGERYRQYQQQKDEAGFIIDDDDDFSKLEAKYRKLDKGDKNR